MPECRPAEGQESQKLQAEEWPKEVVVELWGGTSYATINYLAQRFKLNPQVREEAIHQATFCPERVFLAIRVDSEEDINKIRQYGGVQAVWTSRQPNPYV